MQIALRLGAAPEPCGCYYSLPVLAPALPGANLARLEGQEAFRAITQRFAPFRLAIERLEYQTLLSLRGLKALQVSWS
jgi:hypothetical protein